MQLSGPRLNHVSDVYLTRSLFGEKKKKSTKRFPKTSKSFKHLWMNIFLEKLPYALYNYFSPINCITVTKVRNNGQNLPWKWSRSKRWFCLPFPILPWAVASTVFHGIVYIPSTKHVYLYPGSDGRDGKRGQGCQDIAPTMTGKIRLGVGGAIQVDFQN